MFGLLHNAALRSLHPVVWLSLQVVLAFGIGFAAGKRGWLLALAAYFLGICLWVVIELRPSPPWASSDVWGWNQWLISTLTVIPSGAAAALVGAAGGWVRVRRLRLTREADVTPT